jgi:hypothetical protein
VFLGHYGAALAFKRVEPKVSLGSLFVATQLADVLWGAFLLLGWEHARILPDDNPLLTLQFYDYPISHSLLGILLWGLAAAAVYYSWPTRDTTRHWQAAMLIGLTVVSHWLLDVLVHIPDLPLADNESPKLGLGLWRHFGLSVAFEFAVLGAGLAVYVARRSRRHPVRSVRLALITALLTAVYIASLLGPPPPSMTVLGMSDVAFLLLVAGLAGWADQPASAVELSAHPPR